VTYVLGVSAYYHDSAACLVRDGEIVAAAQEEAFTRKKHDARFPVEAIRFCLDQGGIDWEDLDWIAFYELPARKLARILSTRAAVPGAGRELWDRALRRWTRDRLDVATYFPYARPTKARIVAIEHHLSHAASAFFPSPFEDAAILTVDGVGEDTTTSIGRGDGHTVRMLRSVSFPHSLGLLYSAFTHYCGFKVNSGEYKLMGLAPYGEPTMAEVIERELIKLGPDGSYRLNLDYFTFLESNVMTGRRLEELLGAPARQRGEPLRQHDMDVARSIQVVLEKALLGMAREARSLTGARHLCLAGGVALNCVANSRILLEGPFEDVWIQPAAGDAGSALGAALYVWHQHLGNPRSTGGGDAMKGALLGPSYSDTEVSRYLDAVNASYEVLELDALTERTAQALSAGSVVGWFQGRMEFGPRALGNRSILADPRDRDMQRRLNAKVKARESFRPFAPAVLYEDSERFFAFRHSSPYMLFVAPVAPEMRREERGDGGLRGIERLHAPRSTIPAVTHVDYSARLQTVQRETNPRFWGLLDAFKGLTGCPVLVNTSFNVRGEPIVRSPEDAFRCFMNTDMDHLAMGNHLLAKDAQRDVLVDCDQAFEAD
jgi:carbamoyltransferase